MNYSLRAGLVPLRISEVIRSERECSDRRAARNCGERRGLHAAQSTAGDGIIWVWHQYSDSTQCTERHATPRHIASPMQPATT